MRSNFMRTLRKCVFPTKDLSLMEYQVQSKPWSNNLQFSISPYTVALSIFDNIRKLTPSMLKLSTIQVSYAGMTKPTTAWLSSFYSDTNELQQRYRDTYEEAKQM